MMKNLLGKLLVVLVLALGIASCAKDNNNDDLYKQYEEQERIIDSTLAAQKIDIEAYVNAHLPDAEEDSITIYFQFLDKEVKRGIWYELDNTAVEDDSYEYEWTGTNYVYPKVKLTYTAKLLDGTIVESAEEENFNFGIQSPVINNAWFVSFFPYSIRLNVTDKIVGGLTKDGLKKDSKITVVTPSYFTYGATKKTGTNEMPDIPANSPLVYEFTVISIQ